LSVVVFDIDRFKSINDRLGHALGDAVLREVGATLRSHCRAGDVAARLGGEEFVLLLAGAACEHARAVAERVREEIALADWGSLAAGLVVTVSAGVAVDPGQGSAASLLRLADEALYRAKGQGRNRVCVA
jgi:diguanylate cyclase (GGDEF)-like protein